MSAKNEADIDSDEEEVPELQAQGEPEVAEPPAVTDLSNSEVVTKYQDAAKIAQLTLQQVILKVIGNFFSFYFLNFFFFLLKQTVGSRRKNCRHLPIRGRFY